MIPDFPHGTWHSLSQWKEILPKVDLGPSSRHLFKIPETKGINYVKLNMYPDGGIVSLQFHQPHLCPRPRFTDCIGFSSCSSSCLRLFIGSFPRLRPCRSHSPCIFRRTIRCSTRICGRSRYLHLRSTLWCGIKFDLAWTRSVRPQREQGII